MSNLETVTIQNTTTEPTLEETAKAMGIDPANVDDTAQSQSAPQSERPAWLPEKFKSVEELAASYAELESKLGKTSELPSESTEKEQGEPEPTVEEVVENAGLNFDDMAARYWEKGELPAEDYEALEKANIPRSLVDQFIEGQKAVVEAQRQTVFSTVGGEAKYNDMLTWAAQNYTKAEVEAFNKAVNGPDMNATLLAVKGLQARYTANYGVEPSNVVEGKTPRGDNTRYESIAQLQKDMGDPRYQKDPAFRAKVEAKLARSDIF
ncbi:DNA/RNA endonuclease YhcR with UshA esterase domain [Rhodoblastus acidophilus]|uniref:capsid assembly protein n=1 Tax=Rhodoblastus acidophilus TaxID=1074 RepID=UPI0022256E82|nr:hypothetical protein [Rhodoblastus acidophilus]MCW2286638.1 DNA/RNA endonuclease YhcR with UshA esterase domain [Rhodoblastus acidophilus]MCW2335574.1 DNA/RNA endonuclease YhcR with UshA esterase domain [Rhodoblastus acidophilus]